MADMTKDWLADPFRIARASRYAAPGNGGDALPIVYGDLTVPARTDAGVYVLPKIDTAGAGTYCVAGHAALGAVSLFDDDGLIAGGDYTLNLADDFQGVGVIATAAFSAAPNGEVTAVCKGKKDASGALIENPARIAEDLMVNVWGYTSRDLDQVALGRAVAAAAGLGYLAAGVIADDRAPAEVLTGILADFLGWYEVDPRGRLRLGIAGPEAGAIRPALALPSLEAASVSCETSREGVVNQVPALFSRNFTGKTTDFIQHDDGAATLDAASQALYGVRLPARGRLEFEWIRGSATARAVQGRIVERMGAPSRILTIRDSTWRALLAEAHDYVVFSVPWLRTEELEPLTNQIGDILSIARDLREQTMEIRIRDTGYFLTAAALADGSETADGGSLAGGRRDFNVYA